ncbi:ATP-dependent RNA helicase dbp6 [Tulasnella sp. 419]|nr:ATP-dependent RNA helicase dbp6 [Tulasnella sp. 419]
MRKYVHRVGRTARAGRKGDAWTLVEEQEAHHFKQMLALAKHKARVKRIRISDADLEALQEPYQAALTHLKETFGT